MCENKSELRYLDVRSGSRVDNVLVILILCEIHLLTEVKVGREFRFTSLTWGILLFC